MSKYVKYPRTPHLFFSKGSTSDDKFLKDYQKLISSEIVVTLKMDGENSTLYNDYYHARSLTSDNHYSRNWLKKYHSSFAHEIPDDMRICGENMYAKHSIHYDNLKSYFYGFSIWEKDTCLSWDKTLEWFELLGICPVECIYRGPYDENVLLKLVKDLDHKMNEGFVVRVSDSFSYKDFTNSVAKYVRENHVQTDSHWKFSEIIPNKLSD